MVAVVLERVPARVRGEWTRWMLEPRTGVFVGTLSAVVREKLWQQVCRDTRDGGCGMIHRAANEQGFLLQTWGDTTRWVEDFDGLSLIRIPS